MTDRTESVLAIFAHPDDETFLCAGIFAALRAQGTPVTLVSATRGEAGEINDPDAATRDNLGEVRESELRKAMASVGVTDVRFLDYRDSGMAGTPENDDPRSFMQAPADQVTRRILSLFDELRPATVITFDPVGIYGHPDHLRVHQVVTDAVFAETGAPGQWRPNALYYATNPREFFIEMGNREGSPFEDLPLEELQKMGTPLAEITTRIDISPFLDKKKEAFQAHRTQFGDEGPLAAFDQDEIEASLSVEYFVEVPLPWATASSGDPIARLAASFPARDLPPMMTGNR